MQIDVDIGSSSVARSVMGLVLGYVTSLVVDLAILIEVCVLFSPSFLLIFPNKKFLILQQASLIFHSVFFKKNNSGCLNCGNFLVGQSYALTRRSVG